MNKLNRKDIILFLLYASGLSGKKGEPIKGTTRFTKLLFLLKELYHIDKEIEHYYSFEAYKLGPFTEEVYDDLDVLESIGLIEITAKDFVEVSGAIETQEIPGDLLSYMDADAISTQSYKQSEYRLTEEGWRIAQKRYNEVSSSIKQAVEDVKRRFGSLSLVELLRYIYRKFPEMAKRTVRENLRGR